MPVESGTNGDDGVNIPPNLELQLEIKKNEMTKLEDKYKKVKEEKKSLEKKKEALETTILDWKKKHDDVCDDKKALGDEIKHYWESMVAYSIIRGYPRNDTIQRKRRGNKNRGNYIALQNHCCEVTVVGFHNTH